jgi:hypothetical protein
MGLTGSPQRCAHARGRAGPCHATPQSRPCSATVKHQQIVYSSSTRYEGVGSSLAAGLGQALLSRDSSDGEQSNIQATQHQYQGIVTYSTHTWRRMKAFPTLIEPDGIQTIVHLRKALHNKQKNKPLS